MDNLPIDNKKEKLNLRKKLEIIIFLAIKHKFSDYQFAPKHIQENEKVQKKIFGKIENINNGNIKKIEPYFIAYSHFFNKNARDKIIEIIIEEKKYYSIIPYLSSKEQYYVFVETESSFYREDILKKINREVVEKLIKEKNSYFGDFTDNVFKPVNLKYCADSVQIEIISKNQEFIKCAKLEIQVKYLEKHEENIDLVEESAKQIFLVNNIDFLNRHIEYVKAADGNTQLLFAAQNKENIKYIGEEYQIKIIAERPEAFEYASEKIKNSLFKNRDNQDIINNLLKFNVNYLKNIGYEKDTVIVNRYLERLQEDIKNIEIDKLVDIFIKNGILFAKGNLRSQNDSYYPSIGEHNVPVGVDIYSKQQLDAIQKLNIKQISKLVEIDTNYIMPYVTGKEANLICKENIEELKEKCKQVFIELYGASKFKEIGECINTIFDEQLNYQINCKDVGYYQEKVTQFKIPLESLKLLFNKKIILSNTPELIKNYYSKLFKGTEGKEEFKRLIQNAYGNKSVEILNSRRDLDVYGINSLEIFDERILNNFSEEFVHDLISYNIRDFSAFLHIIKNEEELELFKKYYEILSQIMGKNVATMQKTISEFYYNKELIKSVNKEELEDEEQINLKSVLCGEKNYFDINTIEQLKNFDEIANADLQKKIDSGMDIKELIISNIFGISQEEAYEINSLFGLEVTNTIMDDEEKAIVGCLKKILNENNTQQLRKLSTELMNKKGIRNPIALYSAIAKIKEHSVEFLKARMLTKDKLDKICSDEKKKEKNERKIEKANVGGVEIYYFNGLKLKDTGFGFITHQTYNNNGRAFMEHEGQSGMSTISARLSMDDTLILALSPSLIFTEIQEEDLVAFQIQDAGVLHSPKLVKSKGTRGNSNIGETHKFDDGNNELAFYRRTRNHDKRDKEKKDGRIKPSYIIIFNDMENPSKDKIPYSGYKYAKKYGIPIIVYNREKYKEEMESKDNER